MGCRRTTAAPTEDISLIWTTPEGKNFRPDLIYALDVGANERQEAFFLLSEFPNMLRKVILKRFPSWGAISVLYGTLGGYP